MAISNVYVIKVDSQPDAAMGRLVSKLDLPQHAQTICIKLNLCDYRYKETGATSDPHIVGSLLSILRKKYPDSSISMIENDAFAVSADNIFSFLGFDDIAEKYDCSVVNLAHERWTRKKIDGLHFKSIRVPEILERCDLFITHPKLKTHSFIKATCSLKNQFGCLKPKKKNLFHKFLDEAIVDANIAMKPHLSIVDANICLEGSNICSGPVYGTPKKLGLLIGGSDLVAVDAFCARLMGFKPRFVGHIRKAAAKRVGSMKYSLEWVADPQDFDFKKCKFNFNRWLYYALKIIRWRFS